MKKFMFVAMFLVGCGDVSVSQMYECSKACVATGQRMSRVTAQECVCGDKVEATDGGAR